MIVYHPVYDTYHCLTRTLKILRCLGENLIKRQDKNLRLLFLFPCETGNITLPGQFSTYKKSAKQIDITKYMI